MDRLLSRVVFCLLVLGLLAATCHAQTVFSGNIQGVISDPSGAAIAAASVELTNLDTGVKASATTSASGNYRFSSLQPGRYEVKAEAKGFRPTEVTVTLTTAETEGANLTLPVASAAMTVTVNDLGEVAPIDTDDSRVQATLSGKTVQDLPLLDRNIYDVLSISPGVVGTGTRGAGEAPGGEADNFGTQTPQLSANGRSYTGNRVIVDGMDATSNIQNGNIIWDPNPDSVQEMSLQTNSFDAENNLGSSILIQITTKSGTNKFHGTGSYLFTDQDLIARNAMNGGLAYPPFKRNDLSAALGGPIIKDKTFFFADVESLWSTNSSPGTFYFEDPAFVSWAQANFPNNLETQLFTKYPLAGLKSTGVYQTAAQYFPAGTCGTAATDNIPCSTNMLDQGGSSETGYYNGTQYNFRVDQYIGSKDRIYANYANDSFTLQNPNPRQGMGSVNVQGNWYAQGDWTHTFSPSVLLQMSFAANKVAGTNGTQETFTTPEVNFVTNEVGFASSWGPGTYEGRNYNWRAVLSYVRGAHALKFGFQGTHAIEDGNFTSVNVLPSFTFTNLLSFVSNDPYSLSSLSGGLAYAPLTGAPGTVIFGGQETPVGIFVQDDWKIKSNLSVSLGLRWDDFTNHSPWDSSGFQFSSLLLGSGSSLLQQVANAGVHPVSAVFANSMNNLWSPRIGFAWDPSKRGTWTVRGGIGVYRDWVALGQTVDEMRNNPPGVLSENFTNTAPGLSGAQEPLGDFFGLAKSPTYPYGFAVPTVGAVTLNPKGGIVGLPTNVWSLARDFKAPLAANYVIGVEHELPGKFVVGANYSGSHSYNGLTGSDQNRTAGIRTAVDSTTPGGLPTVVYQVTRPNTSFGTINYVTNSNAGTYNAMILSLRRTVGSRGTFETSYTLSHAMDYPEANTRFDQDGGLNIPDQAAYFNYWGDANWDVRQRFSFSGHYTFPGVNSGWAKPVTSGWEISSNAAVQTGTPFWVIDNRTWDPMCQQILNGVTTTGGCNGYLALQATTGASVSLLSPLQLAPDSGDYNADFVNYDVPNTPTTNFTGSHSRQAYINGLFTAADFPQPAAGSDGNLKRNIYRNPGMIEWDASVLKNTHIPWLGEQGNLQLRFDFINLINRVNLGPVDSNMGDPGFGRVSAAMLPRQLMLGARITF